MPRFAANLSMLFTELPFLDRLDAAAKAGFKAVEYISPYDYDPAELRARLDALGLKQALFNLPAGDWAKGDRGIACDPARVDEFRDSVATSIRYAQALSCPRLNCLSGIKPTHADADTARATFVGNLRYAAAEFAKAKLTLLIEAINVYDIPGFWLNYSAQAIAVMDEIGADNLKFQYDIYHMQRMEGELAATIERLLPRIGHFQLADNPGRHEPGTGEINYPFLFAHLDRIGYDGWIGCEYKPAGETRAGLSWMDAWR
ncbi:MAG: hydroxypyruvate isomerase [Dongiaceae bacterium]